MIYDSNDAHSVALCAWKEARGDGDEAMRAVMHVILNRAGHPGFAPDLHGVVYGKNQFTSMSVPSDPEFNLEPKPGDEQFSYCLETVEKVLDAADPDPTNGAHFYENPKTANSPWFLHHIINDPTNHPQVAIIGKQYFYV